VRKSFFPVKLSGHRRFLKPLRAGLLTAGLLASTVLGTALPSQAAAGVAVTGGMTFPANGVWMPGALGGHVWVSDGVAGFCRVDPQPLGGALLTNCRLDAAKSPSQAVFDATRNVVYVADKSSKSQTVATYAFSPLTETLGVATTITVQPAAGARPDALALSADGNTLYVGYIRSNTITAVSQPFPLGARTVSQSSFTSDPKVAKGANSLAMVGGDLYLSEINGNGVTVIPTIGGNAVLPPCGTNGNFCIAAMTAIVSDFPTAIASDGVDVLYIGDTPRVTGAAVLRYRVSTDTQDVYSTNVPPYVFTNPNVTPPTVQTLSTYKGISGLTLTPAGDLIVGDDPSTGLPAPVPADGHLWLVPAGSAPDVLGAPGVPAVAPPPPSIATAQLASWGVTAPKGGSVTVMAEDGKPHIWGPDHAQGVCRFDPVATSTTIPPLDAPDSAACDPGVTVGSPGQITFGPLNADGTRFAFIPDNAVRSPGVWRLTYDPTGNRALDAAGNPIPGTGKGTLTNPVLMAPGKLTNLKPNGTAFGPDGKLYVGDLVDGNVRRISNPLGDPRLQSVEIPYQTNDLRGINGTIAFLGNNLYLPENNAATYFDITACPHITASGPVPCQFTDPVAKAAGAAGGPNNIPDNRLPLTLPPLIPVFVSGVAADTLHNVVYAASSPGAANAVVFRYTPPATGLANSGAVASIYTTRGQLPAQVGANPLLPVSLLNPAVEFCSDTCTRPEDPVPPSRLIGFQFAQGLRVNDPSIPDPLGLAPGALYISDDATAGARAMHGHLWAVPFTP
jgi:hypothetical protein